MCPKLVETSRDFTCFFEVSLKRAEFEVTLHYPENSQTKIILDKNIKVFNKTIKAVKYPKGNTRVVVKNDKLKFNIQALVHVYKDLYTKLNQMNGFLNEDCNLNFKIVTWFRNLTNYTIHFGDGKTSNGTIKLNSSNLYFDIYNHIILMIKYKLPKVNEDELKKTFESNEKESLLLNEKISYLLVNTEFKVNGYLKYLEMSVSRAGQANINVRLLNKILGK